VHIANNGNLIVVVYVTDGADEYASMQTIITTPVEIAHAHNKNFFLGEFGGPHQPRY
jgi:hypothetical protein